MLPTLIISRSDNGDVAPFSGEGRHRAPDRPFSFFSRLPGPGKIVAGVLVVSVSCLVGTQAARTGSAAPVAAGSGDQVLAGADGGSVPSVSPPDAVSIIGGQGTTVGPPGGSTVGNTSAPVVSGAVNGIPTTVLAAYLHASDVLATVQPGCHLPTALLAGIGKVESGHARGGRVNPVGTALSPILGPVLDGSGGTAAIRDTDGGVLDANSVWDRAVGPMQFIPSTWRNWSADGNTDGTADPENVYDASLTAGRYLCADGRDLSTDAGIDAAVLSYNDSGQYLRLVRAWMTQYSGSVVAVADASGLAGGLPAYGPTYGSTAPGQSPVGQPGLPPPGGVTGQPAPTGGATGLPTVTAAPPTSRTTVPPPSTTRPGQPTTTAPRPPTGNDPVKQVVCGVGGILGGLGGLLGLTTPPDPNCP